jgi:GNAT superfamily N-acetyltransferase
MPVVFWLLVAGIFGFLLGAGRNLLGFARALSFRSPVGESNPAPLDRLLETRRRLLEAEREELLRKETRQTFDFAELQRLFRAAWGSEKPNYGRVLDHSFTWVTYRCNDKLTGFANVAWDGGGHFFLLDVTVHPDWRGRGFARRMVQEAIELCRGKGEWLHVDTESVELMRGLFEPCGFRLSPAGVVDLRVAPGGPLAAH